MSYRFTNRLIRSLGRVTAEVLGSHLSQEITVQPTQEGVLSVCATEGLRTLQRFKSQAGAFPKAFSLYGSGRKRMCILGNKARA